MIFSDEKTFLGGLSADLKRLLEAIFLVAILTLFIALLFAPLLEPFVLKDLKLKACGVGATCVEDIAMAERRLMWCRLTLWAIALFAWIFFIAVNMGYNMYGH